MEPLLIGESSRHRTALTDLALELAQKSAGFRRSLPESLLASLADLVRAMNCYYSNLIEGHDTHPVDIERALQGRLQQRREKTRSPARSQGAYRGPAMDRSGGLKGPRRRRRLHPRNPPPLLRSPARGFAVGRRPGDEGKDEGHPGRTAPARCRGRQACPRERAGHTALPPALRGRSMAASAKPTPSSRPPPRIIVSPGFTPSSTATAASPG